MINSLLVANIANAFNNQSRAPIYLQENDKKIVMRFVKEVIQIATIGGYEFNFKSAEPLSPALLAWIRDRGFIIELVGFVYKVSWRHEAGISL